MTDLEHAFKDAFQQALGRPAACHGCGTGKLGDFTWVRFKAGDEILDFEPAPCDGSLVLCEVCTTRHRVQTGEQPWSTT